MKKLLSLIILTIGMMASDVTIKDITNLGYIHDEIIVKSNMVGNGSIKWVNSRTAIAETYKHTITGLAIAKNKLRPEKNKRYKEILNKTSSISKRNIKSIGVGFLMNALAKYGMAWVVKTHLVPLKFNPSLSKKEKAKLLSTSKALGRIAYNVIANAKLKGGKGDKAVTCYTRGRSTTIIHKGYVVVVDTKSGKLVSVYRSNRKFSGSDFIPKFLIKQWEKTKNYGGRGPVRINRAGPSLSDKAIMITTPITWCYYVRTRY